MPRQPSNQLWSSGRPAQIRARGPTGFDEEVRRLGLDEQTSSRELKKWCELNKNRCYIPESLRKHGRMSVDPDTACTHSPPASRKASSPPVPSFAPSSRTDQNSSRDYAARFISVHFRQEHLKSGFSGMAVGPHPKHRNHPSGRGNIGSKSPPSTQYGHRTISSAILSHPLFRSRISPAIRSDPDASFPARALPQDPFRANVLGGQRPTYPRRPTDDR